MAAIRVSAEELRERFNQDIEPHLDTPGWVVFQETKRPGPAFEPEGTQSIMHTVYKDGALVAKFHCFVRPDGTIGASGQRDPKGVQVGDNWLWC